MGEGAWQHDIFRGPSGSRKLTYETILTSVGGPKLYLHPLVLNIFLMYGKVWDRRTLSTNLRSSWERGRGNMIFSEDLAVAVN